MNDLIVVTGSSLPASDPKTGTLSLYLSQLAAAGIETFVEELINLPYADGGSPGTLELTVTTLQRLSQQFFDYERIVLTDGWDVTFYGTKDEVIRKIPTDRCLIGAAKECYPWNVGLRGRTPSDAPWMYANGGLTAGTPEQFGRLADAMKHHEHYRPLFENQGMLNIMLAEKSEVFYHDSHTELFFCLYDGYPELDFERGLPVNTLYGTHPNFLHANGKYDTTEMIAKYERSLL